MSESLANYSGTTLYLDTVAFYDFLRNRNPITRDLFSRLKTAEIRAYTSVHTFDELAYRMLRALACDKYGDAAAHHFRDRDAEVIKEFYPRLSSAIIRLQTFPHLTLLDLSPIDLMLMDENITRYHLQPRTAIHLAAMQKSGSFDLVSHNEDFDRIPEVRRYTLN